MRLIFMGSSEFAIPTLQRLEEEHNIVAVYSRSAKRAGRGMKLRHTPISLKTMELGIPLYTSEVLDKEDFKGIDAVVVVSYGLIIPEDILTTSKYGCFNVHPSLLPRWRGAAPIERAKMAGDTTTGVTVIKMNSKLDEGDTVRVRTVDIGEKTITYLHKKLSVVGAELMSQVLKDMNTSITCVKQSLEGVTYASKLSKEEVKLAQRELL